MELKSYQPLIREFVFIFEGADGRKATYEYIAAISRECKLYSIQFKYYN